MKFYEICRDMASRKNNQETSKQSTLLRWVRPDREPSKTENRGEQAVLEETSQESDEQAAGTSNSSNSNINTTPQGPELPPTPDLPSVSKGPNQPKNFKFPQRTFGNSTKKRSFQPVWFEQRPWLHYVEKTDMVLCRSRIFLFIAFSFACFSDNNSPTSPVVVAGAVMTLATASL